MAVAYRYRDRQGARLDSDHDAQRSPLIRGGFFIYKRVSLCSTESV